MTWTGLFEKWTQMRADFERQVDRILGERIARVRYFDIVEGEWNYYSEYDAPPMGLELEMASGRFFYATWDWEFDQYHVLLKEGMMLGNGVGEEAIIENIDVTDTSRWASVVNDLIVDIAIYWWPSSRMDPPMAPVDIELAFESGRRIFIGARMPWNDGKTLTGAIDHISVVFDDETARRYEVGPYYKVRFDESQWRDEEGNWRVPKWAR